MKHDASDLWFVTYDIADPRRLRRVHRAVKREAIALQYSAFCFQGPESALSSLLQTLDSMIDPRKDDIRAYRLPHQIKVWALGRQMLPNDVTLVAATGLTKLLTAGESQGNLSASSDEMLPAEQTANGQPIVF